MATAGSPQPDIAASAQVRSARTRMSSNGSPAL